MNSEYWQLVVLSLWFYHRSIEYRGTYLSRDPPHPVSRTTAWHPARSKARNPRMVVSSKKEAGIECCSHSLNRSVDVECLKGGGY